MGTQERRSRQKDELRRKILAAATHMFVEEGYENVSMRKIAEAIEYAPSTIYLHFRHKVELVSSICVEAFAELERRLDSTIGQGLPPMEALRLALRQYVQFGLDHPAHYAFVFCTPPFVLKDIDPASFTTIHLCALGPFQRLRTAIESCITSGDMPATGLESTSQSIWLCVHGITSGLIADCGLPFIDRERLIEESLHRILKGAS